jgi:uncharacterized protein YbbC (DUF1343 family)
VDVLRDQPNIRLTSLFAPEHGFAGERQDQAPVTTTRDPRTGLPIHSLYGETRAPTPELLRGIDALVVDLQDVGVRYYTFVWTLTLAMEACARIGLPVIVLDRPNPLGGLRLEGNRPDPAFASFVGLHPVPVVHGLTIGEIARHVNRTRGWNADLTVVPVRGWRRSQRFDATGLPWVLPSPNMPSLATADVYAGMCLLEATNLSEGRGTTRPFEIVGAPFIDGHRLAEDLTQARIPGAVARPVTFLPTFNKWAGRVCGGIQWHVTDPSRYPSFLAGLTLLQIVRRRWPKDFDWSPPPYEYETVKRPMDILCGTDLIRRSLERGDDLRRLAESWRPGLRDWWSTTAQDRLYS